MHASAAPIVGLLLRPYFTRRVPFAVRLHLLRRVPFAVRLLLMHCRVGCIRSGVPFAVRLLRLLSLVLNVLTSMFGFRRMSTSSSASTIPKCGNLFRTLQENVYHLLLFRRDITQMQKIIPLWSTLLQADLGVHVRCRPMDSVISSVQRAPVACCLRDDCHFGEPYDRLPTILTRLQWRAWIGVFWVLPPTVGCSALHNRASSFGKFDCCEMSHGVIDNGFMCIPL